MTRSTIRRAGPPAQRPEGDVRAYFNEWLDRDIFPDGSFWQNVQSWWDIRHAPSVLLLHFSNPKSGMPAQIRRIAEFLNIEIDEQHWPTILEHCSFEYMKQHADSLSETFATLFEGGLKSFIYKGTNGRWRDTLSTEDIEKYESQANANLSRECAHWLATGEMTELQR